MSYTPPAGTAAAVSWVGDAPYTPPAGTAAAVTFSEAAPEARALFPSPLGEFGAVALVVQPEAQATFTSPLGEFGAVAYAPPAAIAGIPSPLGEVMGTARVTPTAIAGIPSPLGEVMALAWHGQPAAPAPDAGETTLRWRARVTLGGVDISDRLVGPVSVEGAEGEAAIAEFSYQPSGPLDPLSVIGQAVVIEFERLASTPYVRRMFTGVVEEPRIDIQAGIVTCLCHDQLQERLALQPRTWIDAAVGGRWSEVVSGSPSDNWEYAQARLASVPASIALDPYGNPVLLPWRGAGIDTAVTVTEDDWDDGSLQVTLPSRDSLRTRVTVRLQYRYQRLRARTIVAEWSRPISFFFWRETSGARHSVAWLTTAMVQSACEGLSGWEMLGTVQITHPAPGLYLNEGWSDGGFAIAADQAQDLVLGFAAYAGARWQQTVTEDYTLNLVNTALETALGKEIGDEIGANLVAEFDQAAWQTDPSVGPGPILVSTTTSSEPPPLGDTIETWQPEGADAAARDETLRVLLDQAWVRLAASTRSGRVSWSGSIRPDLWLDWWITVNSTRLRAAGKVAAYKHVLDPEAGWASTSVELAVALPGNTYQALPDWTLPAAPADTSPAGTYSCTIGAYVGGLVESAPWDEETMIGFATNTQDLLTDAEKADREWYPHQLSIQTPEIEETARDPLTLSASETVSVRVPTDLLEFL
ncbi:hypothetical protein dqs_0635 [Azoarcus olearius]|uniref:hypothetical protein n=1 Tax=Azoarcus sp. (strain BH72) TaxID=418699 RepID=UPI00080615D0|nr:hypothetical protein [Azoarcus olearius]ANQ83711.1 hypothetical protein dqs_0635 [Azoarcus olearius]